VNRSKTAPLIAGNVLTISLLSIGLYWISQSNFLLYHTLVELFSGVIAFGIFILAWNSRRVLRENYLLFVGIAFLFVGGLDLIHAITYQGIGIVVSLAGTNLSSQLWLGARLTESLSLLTAPLFFNRKLNPLAAISGFALVCSALVWAIVSGLFPVCFIQGQGVTPFEVQSEYAILGTLSMAFFALSRYRRQLDTRVYLLLTGSFLFAIGSSLTAVVQNGAYSPPNLFGHIFRLISFYLIYRALIESGIKKPYALVSHELERSAAMLHQSEEEFRTMFELSAVGMVQVDPVSNCFLRINKKFCELTGYTAEELQRMPPADLTHPDDRKQDQALSMAAVDGRTEGWTNDKRYIRKDGTIIWVRVTAKALNNESGRAISVIGIITDITESRQAEQALRESEKKFKLMAASVKDVIWMSTPGNHMVTFINKAYEEIWGRSCESLYQDPWSFAAAIHPDDRERVLADRARLLANDEWRYDYRIVRPDGSERWIEDTGTPIAGHDGQVRMMVGVARDITERKCIEQERCRANEELEAKVAQRTRELAEMVDQLRGLAMRLAELENQERRQVADILHGDLQQLLAAGTMHAERLLLRRDEPPEQRRRQLEFVADVLKKAHATTRALSHDLSPLILQHGSMNDILQWLADRKKTLDGLEVEFTPADHPEIKSESFRTIVFRIVQELLHNIVKHAHTDKAWLQSEVKEANLCITVLDHGCGFDQAFLQKSGTFTSRSEFGLFNIAERVKLLGGAMEIDSRPGEGSRLTVQLPLPQA
jgi:PAS domain S-box-containing protein